MRKPVYREEKDIHGNRIQFELNLPSKDEWNISENFNYLSKPFVFTVGVYEIMKTDISNERDTESKEQKEESIKTTVGEIISFIHQKAWETRLDYLQRLSINDNKCWIIDNGNDICLLLPSEY